MIRRSRPVTSFVVGVRLAMARVLPRSVEAALAFTAPASVAAKYGEAA